MHEPASAAAGTSQPPAFLSDEQGRLPGSVSPVSVLLVALLAVLITFFNLGGYRTLASHEAYAMVPAREMLNSGDWVVPRFGGLPRLQKPPLVYWTIATSAWLFGELNELVGRLHSAFAGLALALLVGLYAARWWGARAGLAAALMQSTAVYVLIFARKAEIDMLLCLLTTGALLLVSGHRPEESARKSFARFAGMWALTALTWMAKFHYGPAMILGPCIAWFVVQRWWGSLLRLANPAGLAVMAAAVLIWPQLLLERVPEAARVWNKELVGRAVGDMGYRPFWFYVPHLLWLPLPWTPLMIAAIPASWRAAWAGWPGPLQLFNLLVRGRVEASVEEPARQASGLSLVKRIGVFWSWWGTAVRQGDCRERFLWLWLLVPLAIVTIQAQKHKHYLMAALPVLTFLAARPLAVLVTRLQSGRPLFQPKQARVLSGIAFAAAAGLAVFVGIRWPSIAVPAALTAVLLAVGTTAAVWLTMWQKKPAALTAIALTFLCCYLPAMAWMMPVRDHRRPMAEFARQVRSHVPASQPVRVYDMGMHAVVYYLDGPVQRVEGVKSLHREIRREGTLPVVLERGSLAQLGSHVDVEITSEIQPDPGLAKAPPDLVLARLSWIDSGKPKNALPPASAPLQQAAQDGDQTKRRQ
ncbi:MAG: glycosyltransferase family 39 protein [Planctomycetaceae bacterium]|nr:glycosyltransferase family 39 protein [Planctomycetaceae bacterium]